MQTKTFEVRDDGTFIPAVGTLIEREFDRSRPDMLLGRAGYGTDRLLLFGKLDGTDFSYDTYGHKSKRTMAVAHAWILSNWDELEDGALICVETILGERDSPKESEL